MTQAFSPLFHRHGGRIDDAKAAHPNAPDPWLDLSTGTNPRAWRPSRPLAADPGPLPSVTALAALEGCAARFFGCDPRLVVAVPGSELALRLLRGLDLPDPLRALYPSYGTHANVAAECVARAAVEDLAGQGGTILLANPNNPDGHIHPPATLLALAAQLGDRCGSLVVDEAFADVDAKVSVIPQLDYRLPIIVLRSFGKFFGLAGVRLGFFVGPDGIVQRMRALLGDWPVSAQAIAWGTAAYGDTDWIADTRAWLRAQASRLDALLERHGLTATGACPLFRLVEHENASAIFERLARRGILTRPFATHPRWLRFGLPGDDSALDRLDRALGSG